MRLQDTASWIEQLWTTATGIALFLGLYMAANTWGYVRKLRAAGEIDELPVKDPMLLLAAMEARAIMETWKAVLAGVFFVIGVAASLTPPAQGYSNSAPSPANIITGVLFILLITGNLVESLLSVRRRHYVGDVARALRHREQDTEAMEADADTKARLKAFMGLTEHRRKGD